MVTSHVLCIFPFGSDGCEALGWGTGFLRKGSKAWLLFLPSPPGTWEILLEAKAWTGSRACLTKAWDQGSFAVVEEGGLKLGSSSRRGLGAMAMKAITQS